MWNDDIIKAAKAAHKLHWRATSDVSTGDRRASKVTQAWQEAVASTDSVEIEERVADGLSERIDVIDHSTATAYEMKVSGKNPHHEFHKDIFKVFVNNHHHDKKLRRLRFITEEDGADRLRKGLGEAVMRLCAQQNLDVQVVGI